MSCNYADGLSPYDNKGVLGVAEKFDNEDDIEAKCLQLVEWLETAKHVVVHTGAGISTSAGIPDFRGPKGVWTLEQKGEKPAINISFDDAIPTRTHMALRALVEKNYVQYIVSQNIDGLHLKSGLARKYVAELHGNMYIDQCSKCRRQFVRKSAAVTVGQKPCGGCCPGNKNQRSCRGGILLDNILDWEHDLPERDFNMAFMHSTLADINITLGTTLQIVPSGNLPLKNRKYDGKLVICNLQPTKHDSKAELVISAYVDNVLVKVCKRLGIEIPEYNILDDPTKTCKADEHIEWTLPLSLVQTLEKTYDAKIKKAAALRKSNKSAYVDEEATKIFKTKKRKGNAEIIEKTTYNKSETNDEDNKQTNINGN